MIWKKYSLIGLIALILTACSEKEKEANDKLIIVTTTGMIADAVKNITGDKAEVIALMGPGVDPHLYKASQGDIEKLRNADIIFYNGLHLEGKMQEIFESLAKDKPVFAVSDGINKDRLLKINTDVDKILYDPHIWFDVALWQEATHYILQQLMQNDLHNAEAYLETGTTYLDSLSQLHAYVQHALNTIPEENRILITSHDAFEYFGRAYGIKVLGLQGISTAAEFGLKDVTDMVDTIIAEKVKAVFVESSVSEKSIRSVQEGCNQKNYKVKLGGTLFSDAMGNAGTPEGTYLGMVRHNVQTISQALK